MLKKLIYTFGLMSLFILLFISAKNTNLTHFVDMIEDRTFDLRQNIIVNNTVRKHNKDIVIVSIDDASYEYILEKYGEWPLPRDVYVDVVEYLEAQDPAIIAFDLMFVKSLKSKENADAELINLFKKYNNVYTSMNFDNQPFELRKPVDLPDDLKVEVRNYSRNVDFTKSLSFTNCRTILQGILDNTSNIGIINVSRADDGILRKIPLFVRYKDEFYPQLALKVGLAYLKEKENFHIKDFIIDHKSNLFLGTRKVYLDEEGNAILNWYGPTGTFDHIPIYKLIQRVNGKSKGEPYDFHNKIIYFGTTAASLFDIKTTPVDKVYPGVEVQATYLNNLLDNSFIVKADKSITVTVSILLIFLTVFLVMRVSSAIVASVSSFAAFFAYILFTYYAMKFGNVWIEIIYPLVLTVLAFICALVVKYLIKSRDFEEQYILATTDGLTELYNHRYFQEQMMMQVENCKRYDANFSLIIIDIDFFKKFNDTFGHQAGDAVLKQVSQVLKRNVRATDIVCRYGGEEMSIILPNTTTAEAYATAEKICRVIGERKFKLGYNRESNVTISLGVSTFPADGKTAAEIIGAADKRLYTAKNNGRNQVGK